MILQVHVVGKGSREGSLKPADSLTPSGPLPVFKRILQDECCRIGETLRLSCQGNLHRAINLNFYVIWCCTNTFN